MASARRSNSSGDSRPASRSSSAATAPSAEPLRRRFGDPDARAAHPAVGPAAAGGSAVRMAATAVEAPRPAAATAAGPAARWARPYGPTPAAWLLGLWLAGCLAGLGRFVGDLLAARRLARGAVAAGPSWRPRLARAAGLVGLRREVRLLLSGETATPMTWGWLRPLVLLPAAAERWDEERRRVVLLHELAHVRRADWLLRLLARLVCSIYWFNPLAWAAARRLAVEQEIACDEEVVALGTRPSSYAGHLLAIARAAGAAARPVAHALDMARRSQMEGRLMSILEGGKRLPGGRGLTVVALVLIAGLVPALAAIEPWAEEQEDPTPVVAGPAGPAAGAGTEGAARVLGELAELERVMQPLEAELAGLEAGMEPIEAELAGLELAMAPVAVELEQVAAELEPFEQTIAAVEAEMEPLQARLQAIETDLAPFQQRLEEIELQMRPFDERREAVAEELEPFEVRLEAIEVELEPLELELERLSEQMEEQARAGARGGEQLARLAAQMAETQRRMEPLHERMRATHEEMAPILERLSAAHREMGPLNQRTAAVNEEMAPVFERMAAVHEELEPLNERIAAVNQQMEPVYQRLGATYERMDPYHQQLGEQHERMQPYHRKMGEIHERMRPLHEEMGRRHRELEQELAGLVERLLASELAGVTATGTDYAPAADRIVGALSLRVEGGTLRIRSSAAELRRILDDSLRERITASEADFADAVERFLGALGELEIAAG